MADQFYSTTVSSAGAAEAVSSHSVSKLLAVQCAVRWVFPNIHDTRLTFIDDDWFSPKRG